MGASSSKKRVPEGDTNNRMIKVEDSNKLNMSVVYIEAGAGIGSGFFLKLTIKDTSMKTLVTANHVVNTDMVNNQISITIHIKKKQEKKTIVLDKKFRKIFTFEKDKGDVTIIEIREQDKIEENLFLEIDTEYFSKGKDIYQEKDYRNIRVIQYPHGQELHYSDGIVKSTNEEKEFEFMHNASTAKASSGSPVILINSLKVIGVHKEGVEVGEENYATFIGYIKNILNEEDPIPKIPEREKKNPKAQPKKPSIIQKIKIVVNVDDENINNDIYFLGHNEDSNDEYKELEKSSLIIDGNYEPYTNHFKFDKIGKHTIIYEFQDTIYSCKNMFLGCKDIISIEFIDFNTENVLSMFSMFNECHNLSLLDLSNFNTINVLNMGGMFFECHSLSSLDLSKFNTEKVINMGGMFYECFNLKSINFSSYFNTQNVVNMVGMFGHCENLKTLDISKFNINNKTNVEDMFYQCNVLSIDNFPSNLSKVKEAFENRNE